ncbi:MAG TPA: hypothetical protein VKU83_11705, partial [Puia sp.]|nr:hypothetical protein [Puia sp.]
GRLWTLVKIAPDQKYSLDYSVLIAIFIHVNHFISLNAPLMTKAHPIPVVIIALVVLLFADFHLSSCTKTNTKTVYDTTVVTVKDTIIVAPTPSKLSLLVGRDWEMDSAYSNYTGPGTGTLVYARGGTSNSQNLDNYSYTWANNGIEWALENGTYYQFPWTIVNGDSTLLKMTVGANLDYARILYVSSTRADIYDSTASYLDVAIPVP